MAPSSRSKQHRLQQHRHVSNHDVPQHSIPSNIGVVGDHAKGMTNGQSNKKWTKAQSCLSKTTSHNLHQDCLKKVTHGWVLDQAGVPKRHGSNSYEQCLLQWSCST
eukprot:133920-Amphidinium_carterae.1